MKTLLGHLYSKIEGSPEDLATESLQYIIESSDKAKKIFLKHLYREAGLEAINDNLYFKTQLAGKNLERPDLIGINDKREEVVIIESKFWAGLTSNQPVEYLKRLERSSYEGNKLMVFICPNQRTNSLWNELIRKCNIDESYRDLSCTKNNYIDITKNINMIIVSWNKILKVIKHELITNNLEKLKSDITQLEGLCSKMDEEAFLPLKGEELGIEIPKRIYGYYNLITKVIDKLERLSMVSKEGLKSSSSFGRYTRYLYINNWGVSLELNLKYWIEKSETPFWIGIKDNNWDYSAEIKDDLVGLRDININQIFIGEYGYTYIPLFLPLGVDEATVIDSVVNDIKRIFNRLGVCK